MRSARFGVFQLDLTARELRKGGTRIQLQHQPFQVLAMLVARPGQVITREELRRELWPVDTYVDFDKGLNTAVKKVRAALADPASHARFVETLPKVGYRFIAPVEWHDEVPAARPAAGRRLGGVFWAAAALAGLAVIVFATLVGRDGAGGSHQPLRAAPLTSYPGVEIHPAFSPDGERVAFSWNSEAEDNYDIYVRDLRSGQAWRLTDDPAEDVSPAWSRDGGWIAFVRRKTDGAQVHVMPSGGGPSRKIGGFEPAGQRFLAVHDVLAFDPGPFLCWSADGKSIVMPGRERAKATHGLYAVSVETGSRRRLTESQMPDAQPALSPDGSTLAFVRAAGLGVGHLFVMPVSQNGDARAAPRRLVEGDSSIQGPAWNRDGSELLFVSGRMVGDRRLFRVSAGARFPTPRAVALESVRVSTPAVSPVGSRLVFAEEWADRNIWRLTLRGAGLAEGPPRRVAVSTYIDKQPQFSPDGRSIVFGSNRSGTEEIWIADADTSNARRITHFGGIAVGSPRWSPDGGRIVFDAFPQGSGEIYVAPAKPGSAARLTQDEYLDTSPSWSGDGRWIYFISKRPSGSQLWKIRADAEGAGEAIQVTRGGASVAPFESPDSRVVYYLKKRELWSVAAAGGSESRVLQDADPIVGYGVGPDGIYYITDDAAGGSDIKHLSLTSGRVTPVLRVPNRMRHLAVSPAGNALLYTRADREAADLLLVEGFR